MQELVVAAHGLAVAGCRDAALGVGLLLDGLALAWVGEQRVVQECERV